MSAIAHGPLNGRRLVVVAATGLVLLVLGIAAAIALATAADRIPPVPAGPMPTVLTR
jgi:hypothetical protein